MCICVYTRIVSKQANHKTKEEKADIEKVEKTLESHGVSEQEHLCAAKVSHTGRLLANKLSSGSQWSCTNLDSHIHGNNRSPSKCHHKVASWEGGQVLDRLNRDHLHQLGEEGCRGLHKGRDAISNFGVPAGYDVDHLKYWFIVTYLYETRCGT